jgi:SSS family solute:Na+ symporter
LFGGQYAIIRTDVLDILIIFIGVFAGLGILLWQMGGIAGITDALPASKLSFPLSSTFSGADLASYLLLVGLTYVVGPDMYSRLFCAKDGRTAKISVFWTALFLIPFALGITLIGMGAFALYPNISPEQAFPALITGIFPTFVAGLVLAALVSAIMSSADATLLSASTILSVDVIGYFRKSAAEKKTLNRSRWLLLAVGAAALGLALVLNGVISALLFAYTIYTCGVILPAIAGFYKDRLKVTSNAALASIIGGGIAGLISKLLGVKYLDLGALLLSVLLLLIVSLLENRLKKARAIPNADKARN